MSLRPQEGVRGQTQGVEQESGCKKPHQKILFLAEVMNFLNLAHIQLLYTCKLQNRDISKKV